VAPDRQAPTAVVIDDDSDARDLLGRILGVRTQLYLDEEMHGRLRELAERQGRTVSDLVREAVART